MEKGAPFRHFVLGFGTEYGMCWCYFMVHFGPWRTLEEALAIHDVRHRRFQFEDLVRAYSRYATTLAHEEFELRPQQIQTYPPRNRMGVNLQKFSKN